MAAHGGVCSDIRVLDSWASVRMLDGRKRAAVAGWSVTMMTRRSRSSTARRKKRADTRDEANDEEEEEEEEDDARPPAARGMCVIATL